MNEEELFARLFRGRTDVIGKAQGTPRVERRPVTVVDYEGHLAGDGHGIGIYPMLDDNTCWFGAVDLDEPDFKLARQMQKLIPGQSWLEESKSGNAHVWVFFADPCPAWAIRTILRGATQSVGRSDVEIFPKQDALRKDMIGNFINLPYHGEARWMLDERNGEDDFAQVDLDFFLGNTVLQDPDAWVRRARALGGQPPEEREASTEWGEQPNLHMCAEYILTHKHDNPLTPGHRSVVLFNVSRQLLNWRECTEREARLWVHELNAAGSNPASPHEVDRQFDNARDGRWTGTGCDDPVMQGFVHPDCPIAQGKAGR